MAKIDEERILIRFSTIIPDTGSISDFTILTESVRANIEALATDFIATELNASEATANIQVIVEANIIAAGSNI